MTEEQLGLSDTMIRYWATFARHGDPNGAGLPEWPRFTTPDTVLSLAPDAIGPVDYAQEHRLAFWTQIGV
jgi:para-nitrobenzyl esterase